LFIASTSSLFAVGVISLPETELFSGNKGTVQVCATLSAEETDTTVHAISISLTVHDGTGENNTYTLAIDGGKTGYMRKWLNQESGLQETSCENSLVCVLL
jgi:hypothetical protein